MIADWSVDIGADSPWITLPWEGWIDLRSRRDQADQSPSAEPALVVEVQLYPELAPLLQLANRGCLTSAKVDVFPVARHEVDPEISEQGEAATAFGLGSYLDLLASQPGQQAGFAQYDYAARACSKALSAIDMPLVCIEIVIRRARLYHRNTFGWTLYAMGFGPDPASARQAWSRSASTAVQSLQQVLSDAVPHPEHLGEEKVPNPGE